MDETLYRIYRYPGGPKEEKEDSKTTKRMIWEYVREGLIIYHYKQKWDQAIIDGTIVLDLRDTSQPSYSVSNEPIMEK